MPGNARGGGWAGIDGSIAPPAQTFNGCGGGGGQEHFAEADLDLPAMLDATSGHFGNSINFRSGGQCESINARTSSKFDEPGQSFREHGRHLDSYRRPLSQVDTPPQPDPPVIRSPQASFAAEPATAVPARQFSAARYVTAMPIQPDRALPSPSVPAPAYVAAPPVVMPATPTDNGVLLPQRPQLQPAAASVCPHCGNVYAIDSKFCRKCGQKRALSLQPPLAVAQNWVASYPCHPVVRTPAITYPNGCHINFQEVAPIVAPVAAANESHRPRMIPHIESGDLVRQTLQTYMACDRNHSGNLHWNNGEIQDFISAVFRQQGLAPPNDSDMYQLFIKFDEDKNSVLDARECVCLVDALFRAVFYSEEPHFPQSRAALPPPRVLNPHGGNSAILQTRPSSYLPAALPSSLSIPSTRDAADYAFSTREPSRAPSTDHSHILEPLVHQAVSQYAPSRLVPVRPATTSYLPAESYAPRYVDPISRHPEVVHRLADSRLSHPATMPDRLPAHSINPLRSMQPPHSMLPASSIAPAHSLALPPPPEEEQEEEDHVKIPHKIEDMGDGVTRKPPRSTEKPPAWHDIEEREHLIEVDLEELEVHPAAPDLQPGFFESVKYYVSFHPRSEEPDHIPLPRDPPVQSVDGHYLVSSALSASMPGVQVGGFFANKAEDSDSEEEGKPTKQKKHQQYPVATFKEKLALRMDKLDHYLVAYVWASKSSYLSAQTTTLVGRALAPLQDYKLQRRATTWGIFDVIENHRVADMRLKYHACTTPGPVQKPTATDIKQTEVTARWSAPLNDHGAPVIGYKISILLDAKRNEGPQWYTLCERTKSLNPVYVVANLSGNTLYLLDVRAVNKVGVGDPCEFEITTAPVEPDPPSRPWIEEVRDGCLNVAWHPPESDGGMPIAAFRVRMRKIIGASKWNPFGPGESAASWVEMGNVGAAMNEQTDTTMYNAWVGPLETKSCEYRFQVLAVNKIGESRPSELSDPHYT
eukprot:TRINITY_DN33475_c0_g1_i1.p1 TRINITY_DN33475_c0_g1~~TRINITY_DN33475_c0_g1_i1.p1  ORF type:complete len:984 (+),score=123.35 TRINITY_DN33475_c0_g1_i1:127-3078(+)